MNGKQTCKYFFFNFLKKKYSKEELLRCLKYIGKQKREFAKEEKLCTSIIGNSVTLCD